MARAALLVGLLDFGVMGLAARWEPLCAATEGRLAVSFVVVDDLVARAAAVALAGFAGGLVARRTGFAVAVGTGWSGAL